MSDVRIVIADDHPLSLRGICDFLIAAQGFEIVARCSDGVQALKAIRELKPEIAVLDISMPGLNGLEILAESNRETLGTRIVFLSATINSRQIMVAMAEGASGLLRKDFDPDAFLRCVRSVAAGEKCLPFELLERIRDEQQSTGPAVVIEDLLTPREWKVMALAAEGLSNKEIARALKISEGTAKIHLNHIFKKVGVSNRTALANVAFRHADEQSR